MPCGTVPPQQTCNQTLYSDRSPTSTRLSCTTAARFAIKVPIAASIITRDMIPACACSFLNMKSFSSKAVLALSFLLISYSDAQGPISINSVPTSGCVGNPVGTATFTSDVTLATGEVRVPAGSFWNQAGALWEFSTDSKGSAFQDPGIPGYGAGFGSANDIPAAAESAVKLSNDKSTISIVIPTSINGREWDVVWQAVSSSVANSSTPTNHTTLRATWPAGACSLS